MIDRTPEWLALQSAAHAYEERWHAVNTLEARAYSSRDWQDVEAARADMGQAYAVWFSCFVRWEAANNARRA